MTIVSEGMPPPRYYFYVDHHKLINLPESGLRILRMLAFEGPLSMYQMKRNGLSYGTVHPVSKLLAKYGLVIEEKISQKRGRKDVINNYKISTLGLAWLIGSIESKLEDREFEILAGKNSEHFPLILGKWTFYSKVGLTSEARWRFVKAIDLFFKITFPGWLNNPTLTDVQGLSLRDSNLRLNVTVEFLVPSLYPDYDLPFVDRYSMQEMDWMSTITKEPELYEWTCGIIQNKIDECQIAIRELEKLKTELHMPKDIT